MKRVIVIGAGFGGLSSAALLQKQGYQVTVVEKNKQPGGRAMLYREKGFSFDMGPSWYLQPEVFEHFFAQFGKKPSDYYELKRLDPAYRIFFGAQDAVDISADLSKNLALFERIEPGSTARMQEYLAQAKYKYDVSMQQFLYKDYKSITDFFTPRLLREGMGLHVFESFDRYTKRFFKTDRMQKIVQYPVVFLGGNPKKTPALYSLLAHADYNLGVWYPMGGMNAVAKGMYKLAASMGVEFKFDHEVQQILVTNGAASGVQTSKGLLEADVVLVNADYAHAETQLLAPQYQTYPASYWKKRVVAPSGFIIYLGLSKRLKNLTHHNLFFDNDWTKHFDDIFEKPGWPESPSYYICCPSKTDRMVAPYGNENLFILVPVASGLEDTDELRARYTEKIITHLETITGEPIRKYIVVKKPFSHRDFKSLYNAYQGTALGIAHTLLQSAVFRPSHRSKKVKNLYYAGQYTHPGIGVPMTIIAGHVVSDIIHHEQR